MVGARGAFLQHRQPRRIEACDDVANRLVVAAELAGYDWGSFASGGGQHDLAASQDKSIRGMQAFVDLLLFVFGEGSGKNGFSHTLLYHIPSHLWCFCTRRFQVACAYEAGK